MWLLILGAGTPGCISDMIARQLIAPPNGGRINIREPIAVPPIMDAAFRVAVGPPHAELVYWIIEPKSFEIQLTHEPKAAREFKNASTECRFVIRAWVGNDSRTWYWLLNWKHQGPIRSIPRGTILFLQGWGDPVSTNPSLWPVACIFANAGYRVVMPDLRGHGESTGASITWGIVEARDLKQLVDELERRGFLAGPLGLFGHSYGASVGIMTAAADSRVRAVIAVAGAHNMMDGVPVSARAYRPRWAWLMSDALMHSAVRRAGVLGGFDVNASSAEKAIKETDAHVLLVHGADDPKVLASSSRRVYDSRPERSELIVYDGEDHNSFMVHRFEDCQAKCVGWFDRWLGHGKRSGGMNDKARTGMERINRDDENLSQIPAEPRP